ncbi:hypothetical protein [Chryseobacterium taiwanense]|uniref:Uncharacterized protein n=1 Tax=Chryseobacterium taiwanense TaxID=363331 RepID=A0A0B4DIN4_9FLAO|nr:hypothetical protein [Chryseobacterium taiwanense]KIC64245.1 hypothetical protein RM51_05905 [Chryseobacterium taiwanense]
MFLKSEYRVEFSKSKEDVLENIKNSIFGGFPDFFGKSFTGKVFENGFKVRLMQKDFQTFKGNFIRDNEDKYSLELFIGLEFYQLLTLAIFFCFSLTILIRNFSGEYYILSIYLMVIGLVAYKNYRDSKKEKQLFFDYLKNFDRNCEIVPIK